MQYRPRVTILLAEDDPENRDWIVEELNHSPFIDQIEVVNDGAEMLSYLNRHRERELPALILLDIQMPRHTDLEAIREIRSDPQLRKTPVIIFTESESEEYVFKSYDLGVNAYVKKPKNRTELAKVLATLTRFWLQVAHLPNHRPSSLGVH